MVSATELKKQAILKGLQGSEVDRFVFGTINKLKSEGEQSVISPAPHLSATVSAPNLTPIRRGVLASAPIVQSSPTIFGGGKIPLAKLMQGKLRPGGTKRLGATRAFLGTTA